MNASTGEVAQRLDYDAWGNVTNDTDLGFQPFGCAGGIYDRDTGLIRLGARDYDPYIARWTTKDPTGFGGGLNHYGYVNNNPVNYSDPTGEVLIVPFISAGVGAVLHGVAAHQNGASFAEVASAAFTGAATNIIPGGALAKGASSVVGNALSLAYDQCFSGVGDIDWSQAVAAGALGTAGVRPFRPTSTIENVVNEATSQVVEGQIAGQF